MKKFLPQRKGFTLIELLVVIAIIAILSMIGMTVYTGSQKKARDAKRQVDADAIANALEIHYRDTGCGASAADYYCSTGHTNFKYYFVGNAVPTDPKPTWNYQVSYAIPNSISYTICARLENNNGNASAPDCTTNPCTFTFASGDTATYYCRKNQQ